MSAVLEAETEFSAEDRSTHRWSPSLGSFGEGGTFLQKSQYLSRTQVFFFFQAFRNDKLHAFVCRLDEMKLLFSFALLSVTHPCSIKARSDLTL